MRTDWLVLGGIAVVLGFVALKSKLRPESATVHPSIAPITQSSRTSAPPPSPEPNYLQSSQESFKPVAPRYFSGYACTSDCSGHEAGYEWAENNGIEDPDDCDGNSESFIEGCRAFAEEQGSANKDESEGEEDEEAR